MPDLPMTSYWSIIRSVQVLFRLNPPNNKRLYITVPTFPISFLVLQNNSPSTVPQVQDQVSKETDVWVLHINYTGKRKPHLHNWHLKHTQTHSSQSHEPRNPNLGEHTLIHTSLCMHTPFTQQVMWLMPTLWEQASHVTEKETSQDFACPLFVPCSNWLPWAMTIGTWRLTKNIMNQSFIGKQNSHGIN